MNLIPIKQIPNEYPFSMNHIRHLLFNRDTNGLNETVIKIGRRLYVDRPRFECWLESHREAA